VAPKAYLGSYKIFGSPGVNDVTFSDVVLLAMEDAVADRMDVITLAVGSPACGARNDRGTYLRAHWHGSLRPSNRCRGERDSDGSERGGFGGQRR